MHWDGLQGMNVVFPGHTDLFFSVKNLNITFMDWLNALVCLVFENYSHFLI